MKKITFLFLFLFHLTISSQNIFVGDVVFNTQSQVDNFASENYDGIDGFLSIVGFSNVNDLSGLASLKSITGALTINISSQLISLEGLHNITDVGGDLTIRANENLENLNGLRGMQNIGASLDISFNQSLNDISALENITALAGYVRVNDNFLLTTLDGLNNLTSIGVADAPTSAGAPNDPIPNASIIIVRNNTLSDCCLLNQIIDLAEGVVDISNNAEGCDSVEEVENTISNCAIEILYPQEGDVYVAGRNIRIQFKATPIFINTVFTVEYSIDNGQTWMMSSSETISSNELNSSVGFNWESTTEVTSPTSTLIRLSTIINDDLVQHISEQFIIHPSNFYETEGFRDDGISEIEFPFNGSWGEIVVFGIPYTDLFAETHNCLDENSRDYYSSTNWHSDSCDRIIKSPIDGKVIFVDDNFDPVCDEFDNSIGGYGNQVVIQSSIDKTFAFRVAHLNFINSLQIGDDVVVGQEMGTVGGTSQQQNPHAHCGLYKNIYTWFPLLNFDGEVTSNTIIELLENGGSFINADFPDECNLINNESSAEFIFINGDIDNVSALEAIIIANVDDLIDFANNAYTNILASLTIESSTVEDIQDLISLRVVEGDLIIRNTNLSSLRGLENLAFVGGNLIIEDNLILDNYCALRVLLENNALQGNLLVNGNLFNPEDLDDIISHSNCDDPLSTEIFDNKENIIYFPNPTKDYITIPALSNYSSVKIYNLSGSLVFELNNFKRNSIDFRDFPSGIYFLKLENDTVENVFRVIKN